MERKPRLTLRDARRLHGAGGAATSATTSSSNPNARAYRIARQTGHLNVSTRAMTAFPSEILRLHELAEEVHPVKAAGLTSGRCLYYEWGTNAFSTPHRMSGAGSAQCCRKWT